MKTLIGIDGSNESFAALQTATRLLSPSNDRVVLYYSPPDIRLPAGSGTSPEILGRARAALSRAVMDEGLARLPEALQKTAQSIVGTRDPRLGIVLAANACLAELIVVGARGNGTFLRRFLGSVAKSVVHATTLPVLVVRPSHAQTARKPLRVLVAFDGSAASREAAAVLKKFTWPEQTSGLVMTVVTPMFVSEVPDWLEKRVRDPEVEAMAQAWVREHVAEKQERLAEAVEFCRHLPRAFHDSKPLVAEGHVAERILDAIEHEQIDLVVLGSNSKGPIDRLLIGSTSDTILSHAPCSVLIVREQPRP